MITIKFRVWDKRRKMWLGNSEVCIYGNGSVYMLADGWQDITNDDNYEIVRYTGRKDKNKNEVYEGDILQSEGEWSIRIEFEKGIFFVRDLNRIRYINKITNIPMALFEIEEFEVVGNIYQNPELLEEG